MRTNNDMQMSNVMSHHTGCDDEDDCSHNGCSSRPMVRRMLLGLMLLSWVPWVGNLAASGSLL